MSTTKFVEVMSKLNVNRHMEKNKLSRKIFGVIWLLVSMSLTWIFFLKPCLEYTGYKANQAFEAIEVYEKAKEGDQQGLIALEQMTHMDSYLANIFLQQIYLGDSIAKSGINIDDEYADLGKVDTSKSDNLILQALREYSDMELRMVLSANAGKWSTDKQKMTDQLATMSGAKPSVRNRLILEYTTTMTDTQKEMLSACYKKLNEKLSNPVWIMANLRSIGTCSSYSANAFDILKNGTREYK
ncbi:hypothetical protein [Pseudomonas putida]|uniref:Uncharacterized protein n=1 Tax=Pseudomonas putida TaxID=303 RepID=A0A8I1EFM7_PSEPU|nr:hypothetical protein [Pseudomonas putida]MBI6885779.1 hypothetical protein [Pseudomonas putida]